MVTAAILLMAFNILTADVGAELSRRKHVNFMRAVWSEEEPFVEGIHTKKVCGEIDKAFKNLRAGKSTFLVVTMPIRHGKSEIISKKLPAHFLGEFPHYPVAVATYAAEFAQELSREARAVIESEAYGNIYPDVAISSSSRALKTWGIEYAGERKDVHYTGKTAWTGIGGPLTGKGFRLGILDDYLKNREDAESELVRNKDWEWFTNVFMTRRAPVSIVIILATPWHVDDIIGRIKEEKKKDTRFPQFEVIRFPAMSDETITYESGYLFPELFPPEWYEGQLVTLGAYAASGLLQCEPTQRGGNMLKTQMIRTIGEEELPPGIRWVRCWDLASSEKERNKDKPDFTAGVKLGIRWERNEATGKRVPHIYIGHVIRFQEEAPARDAKIYQIAEMDGPSVPVGLEVVAGYKDTYTNFVALFKGVYVVRKVTASADKVVRATPLEAPIEAGHFYIVRGEWNAAYMSELEAFPNGRNDDQVDGTSGGYQMVSKGANYDFDEKVTAHKREDVA